MSFERLVQRIKKPGESYFLQVQTLGEETDEIGDPIETWTDTMELDGGVQAKMLQYDEPKGKQEVILGYIGFFTNKLDIPHTKLTHYRIKQVISDTTPIVQYFIIREINRNLTLQNRTNHYELLLEKSEKFV